MNDSINILLVDDELPALENIKDIVKLVRSNDKIFTADNYIDALEIAKENAISVALLDVEMPGLTGVELGKMLKDIHPQINIIFLTAYKEYAYDASELFYSGYLLKPTNKNKVMEQFSNLRFPVSSFTRKLTVQCFGNFDVYNNGELVAFERSKSKEILAYLIDRRGARVTVGELLSVLYEDSIDEKKNRQNFYSAMFALRKSLKKENFEDVLIHSQNAYAVNATLLDCDYYKYLEDNDSVQKELTKQYMYQYSWAETTLATFI